MSIQSITSYIKHVEARGEDISPLKAIMMNFIKKNYKDLDKSINDYQAQKHFSESEFKKFYIMVNSIYESLYNNNKFSIFAYNIELVKEAQEHFKNPQLIDENKAVTITTTTCKRTDLITRTIDSFLECGVDYKKYVKEWIIVDDNSNEKDRAFMKEKYPFIRFIYKDESNKGHPRSMNMFLDEVKTPYVFNLEDDFEFFRRDNFFERMHYVLDLDKSYGQCLMNINYTEDTNSGNNIWGSTMKYHGTEGNKIRYFIHNYYTGKKLEEEQKKIGCPSCLYWPHFSFRVGLTKTSVLKEIGKYDETAKHFEMEYAHRYVNKGYKTTFLDGIYCAHIGRRTYERNTEKKNAYDLNNEVQFGETHRVNSTENTSTTTNITEISTFVINLKRRPDRLRNFFTKNKDELYPITVFEGVDGKTLQPSHKVQKAFSSGDYNYRRGIVGCAMSHIKIWKEFITKLSTNYCIVLEDDAELCKDFHHKILYLTNKHKEFDIMFLHYNPYQQYDNPNLHSNAPPKAEFWTVERSMRENMGSGAGYILSRNGAINLLKHIEEKGVYNAIDWVMFKSSNKVMYTTPMLVRANCFQSTNGRCDTDIQNVFNSVCFKDDLEWDRYELSYLANKLVSSYHNKEKISICNLYYKGFDENVLKSLTFDLKNISTVKNIKGMCMIISPDVPPINYLTDYVCILPVNNLEKLDESINLYPIKRYTTNKYIYCIPDKYADLILDDKVWEHKKLLNTVCPF